MREPITDRFAAEPRLLRFRADNSWRADGVCNRCHKRTAAFELAVAHLHLRREVGFIELVKTQFRLNMEMARWLHNPPEDTPARFVIGPFQTPEVLPRHASACTCKVGSKFLKNCPGHTSRRPQRYMSRFSGAMRAKFLT